MNNEASSITAETEEVLQRKISCFRTQQQTSFVRCRLRIPIQFPPLRFSFLDLYSIKFNSTHPKTNTRKRIRLNWIESEEETRVRVLRFIVRVRFCDGGVDKRKCWKLRRMSIYSEVENAIKENEWRRKCEGGATCLRARGWKNL